MNFWPWEELLPKGSVFFLSFWLEFFAWVLVFSAAGVEKIILDYATNAIEEMEIGVEPSPLEQVVEDGLGVGDVIADT